MPITGKTNLHLITLHLNNLISKSMFFFVVVFFLIVLFFLNSFMSFSKKTTFLGFLPLKGAHVAPLIYKQ